MNTFRYITITMVIIALLSCSQEHLAAPSNPKSREVLFHVHIPGRLAPESRALGDSEENEVKTVEMLLFDPVTKAMVWNPVFANEVVSDQSDFRKKSFSVYLPEGTFDIMIFANARAAFNSVVLQAGDGQEATLAKLKVAMPAAGWNANPMDASKS